MIDVPTGQTVARGFAMPHSPRLYNGRLWVLDSGAGSLEVVDPQNGHREVLERVPGYTRGLACCGQYAFVGLSKIRDTSVFGCVPIAEHRDQLRCGIAVIDLAAGRCVATLQFHSGVEEIFAVQVLEGSLRPTFRSLEADEEQDASDIWVVPPDGQTPGESGWGELWRHGILSACESIGTEPSTDTNQPQDASPRFAPELDTGASRLSRSEQADLLAQQAERFRSDGQLPAALKTLEAAVELAPARAELLIDLGDLCQRSGNQTAALRWYRQAVAVQPDFVAAQQNLGYLLLNGGETDQALKHYARAETLRPHPMNRLLASVGLPVVYQSQADLDQRRARLEACLHELAGQGIQIDTTETTVPTTFLFAYQGRNDRAVMQQFAQVLHGVEMCPASPHLASIPHGVTWQDLTTRPSARPARRIRVGFLSHYFRDHTIGQLNLGRISRLSREKFEVIILPAGKFNDPVAQAFVETADRFVYLSSSIGQARRQIAEQALDLLVFTDVGMDPLAYSRMAPVQCTTWGHPNTTGSRHLLIIDAYFSRQADQLP